MGGGKRVARAFPRDQEGPAKLIWGFNDSSTVEEVKKNITMKGVPIGASFGKKGGEV